MSRKKSPILDISSPTLLNVQLYRAVSKPDHPDEITLEPSVEQSVTLQLPVRVLQTEVMSTLKEVLEKAKLQEMDTATGSSNNETEIPSSLTNSASQSPSSRGRGAASQPNSPDLNSSSQPGSPAIGRSPSSASGRSSSPATRGAESPITRRAGGLVPMPVAKRMANPLGQPSNPTSQPRDEGNRDTILVNYFANEDEEDTGALTVGAPSRIHEPGQLTLQRSFSAENLFATEDGKAALETKAQQKQRKKRKSQHLKCCTKDLCNNSKRHPIHPTRVDRLISAPVLVDKTSFTAELSSDGYALVPTQTRQPNAKPVLSLQGKMQRSQSLEGNLDALDDEDEVCSLPPVQQVLGDGGSADLAKKVAYGRASSEQGYDIQQTAYQPHQQAISCGPCDVCDEDIKKVLFNPRSVEALMEVLQLKPALANCYDVIMEAPIHAILRRKKKWRLNLLITLLSYSSADVNLPTQKAGHTPLHIAVMEEDEMCVKALLAFGANIYATGLCDSTLTKAQCTSSKLIRLLKDVSEARIEVKSCSVDFPDKVNETLMEYLQRKGERSLCDEMEERINRTLSISASFSGRGIDPTAIALQQKEIGRFKSTGGILPYDLKKGGVKILCLDGGGMKGLAQIEVLSQLEEATGRKITDMFDWIVGTSTGAIIALGLVYAKMSLAELRRLYFNMKEKIFGKGRHNSEALEGILKETFGVKEMNDVKNPKVMIGAVNKETTNLHLQFFNNCMDDLYSKQPVWKVARYTSAAPMFFTEFENYVDGGVLANNPCEYALTAIQNFYREQKMRPQISLLVSVGSGVYPALKLGNIDAQQFLYFGIHTFRLDILKDRAANLISLLSNALVESEAVAKNCKSRCEEQGILFYRFSPKLDEVIAAGETDNERLVNMLIKTRLQLKEQGLQDLVNLIARDKDSSKEE